MCLKKIEKNTSVLHVDMLEKLHPIKTLRKAKGRAKTISDLNQFVSACKGYFELKMYLFRFEKRLFKRNIDNLTFSSKFQDYNVNSE